MKIDGSKIIFGLGVASAVATAVIALFFAIQ
jgi:hypothetical protein